MMRLPDNATTGDRLDPTMSITEQDEADRYFETLVEWQMRMGGFAREEAVDIVKANLGYYAGYMNKDIREQIYRLFRCEHPLTVNAIRY